MRETIISGGRPRKEISSGTSGTSSTVSHTDLHPYCQSMFKNNMGQSSRKAREERKKILNSKKKSLHNTPSGKQNFYIIINQLILYWIYKISNNIHMPAFTNQFAGSHANNASFSYSSVNVSGIEETLNQEEGKLLFYYIIYYLKNTKKSYIVNTVIIKQIFC